MSDTSTEKTDSPSKGAIVFLTTALGLWLHVVGLHFFPIATFVLTCSFGLAMALFVPHLARMRVQHDATDVADLGERGAEIAEAFEATARRFGRSDAKLLVGSDETYSKVFARWLPGSTTLVMTRGAYELPRAELEALWALELAELTSRGYVPLRATPVVRTVATNAARLVLIVIAGGTFSWTGAIVATTLVFCVSRTISTSAPLLGTRVITASDRRAIETIGCAREDYVQVIVKMRDGVPEELSSRKQIVESLDARIERIRS